LPISSFKFCREVAEGGDERLGRPLLAPYFELLASAGD
jgi:hypothetical protein